MNSNPTAMIRIKQWPNRIRSGFVSLVTGSDTYDQLIKEGIIVSEVGMPISTSLNSYHGEIPLFNLRAPRINQSNEFMFGQVEVGDAYSAFSTQIVQAPAVGTTTIVNPLVTPLQKSIIDSYNYISADVVYIVHIPSPLGVAIYLRVYAPELDKTTETKGVLFKPAGVNTIAFRLPWSNDLMAVEHSKGRLGQSGLSLAIENIEDNSLETVNSPLNITVMNCVINVKVSGLKVTQTDGVAMKGLNFNPQSVPAVEKDGFAPLTVMQHSDNNWVEPSTEINAEGGMPITEQPVDLDITPLDVPIETMVFTQRPIPNTAISKKDSGQISMKWVPYSTIDLGNTLDLKWKELKIKPYSDPVFRKRGDNFSLMFRRNVWCTGDNEVGYVTGLIAQINIPRPPQISGVLEVKDSLNASSSYLVEFGTRVQIPLMFDRLNGINTTATRPRDYNNPWVRTHEATCTLRYRLIAFNRTAEVSNLRVEVHLRAGGLMFQVPRKPLVTSATQFDPFLHVLNRLCMNKKHYDEAYAKIERNRELVQEKRLAAERQRIKLEEEKRKEEALKQQQANQRQSYQLPPPDESNIYVTQHSKVASASDEKGLPESSEFITPFVGETAENFSRQDVGVEEDINLDAFPVLIYAGDLKVGEIESIVLDMATVKDHLGDAGAENAITQKFLRYANIIPTGQGAFGPVIGNYTIKLRLPTTIAGELHHVCLPGDMMEESLARIFGLSHIAGIAGAALNAVGGPLVNGIVNTGGALLSGAAHAIGGKPAGMLADLAVSGVKGVVSSILPSRAEEHIQGAAPAAITGDIPVSRFVQCVKYVKDNFNEDPVFPTLLVEAKNFFGMDGKPLSTIPIEIFANLKNIKVERELFDRSVYPAIAEQESELFIPLHMLPHIMERFLNNKDVWDKADSIPSINFRKLIVYLSNKQRSLPSRILVSEIKKQDIRAYANYSLENLLLRWDIFSYYKNL